jgi:sugar lactone lactonase YvrE
MKAELVFDARNTIGESPVWLAAEQALYWVDIPACRLHRWDSATGQVSQWTAAEMIGCIAAHAGGGWICAMERGVFHLQADWEGALQGPRLATVDHALPKMGFNDGRCDRQGRFRAGTMLMDMGAAQSVGLVCALADDGTLRPVVEGLIVPNGMAFSPDGRTMYLSDSHPQVQRIWCYDYDTDTGMPSNRRLFVDMKPLPGRPDGAAIDEDGCYWICANDAGLVHRFTTDRPDAFHGHDAALADLPPGECHPVCPRHLPGHGRDYPAVHAHLLPICQHYGMGSVQFGMVMLINCALGLNTPPVGTTQFVGCAIGGVSVGYVMRTIWPFYGALIAALLIVTYVPAFSLWLPSVFLGK